VPVAAAPVEMTVVKALGEIIVSLMKAIEVKLVVESYTLSPLLVSVVRVLTDGVCVKTP